MRRFFAIVFVCLFSVAALAQAKRPFTFEDMMKLKRVGEPVPSPDGKWVLFSVVDVNLEANTKTSHIWIVPLNVGTGVPPVQAERSSAGSSPSANERILIPDQDGTRPRWAPDGKRFAFISNKEGGSQVWIADFDSVRLGTVTSMPIADNDCHRSGRRTLVAGWEERICSCRGCLSRMRRQAGSKLVTATGRNSTRPRSPKSRRIITDQPVLPPLEYV